MGRHARTVTCAPAGRVLARLASSLAPRRARGARHNRRAPRAVVDQWRRSSERVTAKNAMVPITAAAA